MKKVGEEEGSEEKTEEMLERTKATEEWQEMVGKSKKKIMERKVHKVQKNQQKRDKKKQKEGARIEEGETKKEKLR